MLMRVQDGSFVLLEVTIRASVFERFFRTYTTHRTITHLNRKVFRQRVVDNLGIVKNTCSLHCLPS